MRRQSAVAHAEAHDDCFYGCPVLVDILREAKTIDTASGIVLWAYLDDEPMHWTKGDGVAIRTDTARLFGMADDATGRYVEVTTAEYDAIVGR